jgi:hypothetical protein
MALRYPFDAVILAVLAGLIGMSNEVWLQRLSAPRASKGGGSFQRRNLRRVDGANSSRPSAHRRVSWPLFPISVLL